MSAEREFFVVWNPARGAPQYRHASLGGAVTEAERLALKAPGEDFYVLHAIKLSRSPKPVETVDLDDGIPF